MANLEYEKHFKRNDKYKRELILRQKNIRELNKHINGKIKQLAKDSKRKYIQVNTFNTEVINQKDAIDIHNCWIEDNDIACILIYITEAGGKAPTEEQWLTMFGFTSREHEWKYSKKDGVNIDLNGITLTEYSIENAGLVFIPDEDAKESDDNENQQPGEENNSTRGAE